jgi:transcriptional regulator with XRE-family HTH domain
MSHRYTETVCSGKPHYTGAVVCLTLSALHNMPVGYSDRIAALRRLRGLTQEQLAEKVDVEQPTVQRWERGLREPSISKMVQIAEALGVDIAELFGQDRYVPLGPRLYVKGQVAAGVWQEATEWPEDEWQTFTGRPDVTAELVHRFGLRIDGRSMDLLYPPGTIVECVSTFGHVEIQPGRRVVVIREREDHRFEATVKELVEGADGKMWAVPRSTDPSFLPINLSDPEPGIIETRIAAIVVGSYRPE